MRSVDNFTTYKCICFYAPSGTFYQPAAVIADLTTLQTLPDREYFSGIAEVVKYGAVRDAALFCWLELHMERLVSREADALSYMVKRQVRLRNISTLLDIYMQRPLIE